MIAWKFLAAGAVSPFTGFRWPGPGEWVTAPPGDSGRWIHACRTPDLPHWLDEQLWRVELDGPVEASRYQVASPRARLVSRIGGWNASFAREYARTCALRARDLALPHLEPALRAGLGSDDLQGIVEALGRDGAASDAAGYVADAARSALAGRPSAASYVACVLASTLAGGDLAGFEAERGWQARWLVERLGLSSP